MTKTKRLHYRSGKTKKAKPAKKHKNSRHKKLELYMTTQFRYHVLDCGTPVILIHNSDAKSLSVECLINTGSAMEPRDKMGISHFIEHLVFRKTKHFDSQQAIKEFLQEHAIYFNAYTDNTELNYYYSGPSTLDNLNCILYVLKEMMLTSIFTQHSFETEKNIITQELYRRRDDPEVDCWDKKHEHYFRNHPLGVQTSGTEETIRNITLDDVKDYYSRIYTPTNFTIYITGKIPEFNTNKPIGLCNYYINKRADSLWKPSYSLTCGFNSKKKLIGISNKDEINKVLLDVRNKTKFYMSHIPPAGGIVNIPRPGLNQTYISLIFPIPGRLSTDAYLTSAICDILRDGSKAKLFSIIREKYGLSYIVRVYSMEYVEGGFINITIGVNNNDCKRALQILKDIFKPAEHGRLITKDELTLFKKEKLTQYNDMKKYAGICYYSSGIKYEFKIRDIDSDSDKYASITLDKINQHTKQILNMANAIIYIYGNGENTKA